jgi:hypothetical protein
MIKYKQQLALKRDGLKSDARRADKFIFYCTKCKTVWEDNTRVGGDSKTKSKINWYQDFPKYGKQKKCCPKCL